MGYSVEEPFVTKCLIVARVARFQFFAASLEIRELLALHRVCSATRLQSHGRESILTEDLFALRFCPPKHVL